MSVKSLVNDVVGVTGYRISRHPSLARDIAAGKYRWLQDLKIATILDIGANVGQFAGMIRAIIPGAMIYSFEPLEECFRELNARAPSLSPMQCFQYALGTEDGVVTMHRNDFSASSSFLPLAKGHRDAFPFAQRTTDIQIPVRSLDTIAPELTLKSPILMKADIQGYELKMLCGAPKTLSLVDVLILEISFVELYAGQPLFHDLYEHLQVRGFRYTGSLEQVNDPKSGAVLQGDLVFRRV
jgi:FkbM family methyltransferase